MFTGIVEELGKVSRIVHGSKSIRLSIECTKIIQGIKLGDSIAVNGICLTVSGLGTDQFTADVMPETIEKTNLQKLKVMDNVNLERALKLSDRLGGHVVSGHIDGTGIITEIKNEDNAVWVTVETSQPILKYIVLKGSVALDGTSLTVADVDDKSFKISMIPYTRSATVLGIKGMGDLVNIECDVIGKYIEKLVLHQGNENCEKKDLSIAFLKENGFA